MPFINKLEWLVLSEIFWNHIFPKMNPFIIKLSHTKESLNSWVAKFWEISIFHWFMGTKFHGFTQMINTFIQSLNVSWNNLLMMWICGWGHEDGPKKSTKIELPRILIIPQYLINYNFGDGFSSIQQCTVTVFKEQNHKIYLHGLDTV